METAHVSDFQREGLLVQKRYYLRAGCTHLHAQMFKILRSGTADLTTGVGAGLRHIQGIDDFPAGGAGDQFSLPVLAWVKSAFSI